LIKLKPILIAARFARRNRRKRQNRNGDRELGGDSRPGRRERFM
jgi:hypothetical protein